MKSALFAALSGISLIAYPMSAADVAPTTAATPDNQPAAFQSEDLTNAAPRPAGAAASAAPRAPGGIQIDFTTVLTPDQLAQLHAKLDELNSAIKALKDAKADDDLIVDAECCGWIVETTLRVPDSFANYQSLFDKCMSRLDTGLSRAQQIKDGTAAWTQNKGRVDRGYRSLVDGTAQPYHVTIPASYDPAKPMPLYIYLHGMSHFIPDMGWDWAGSNGGRATNGDYIRVEMFGRGNNSFRWAGESDVMEALASVRKRYNIDPDRIVLAGFSMGGAGSWQIGLHNPDMFCGLEIDAGVIGNRLNLDGLTPAQKGATATYGIMIPQGLNAVNVPLVGYAGANDAQLASSTSIHDDLEREGYHFDYLSDVHWVGKDINALFLANPGQAHDHAHGETLQLINDFTAANFARGRVVPDQIRFVTYTLRYNHDFWITVDGLQQQFDQAQVDAGRDPTKASYTIKTQNVSRLVLDDAAKARLIVIDGDTLTPKAAPSLLLTRTAAGHWVQGDLAADLGLRKQHDLQGPINDAFFDSFLCVTPSGTPNNAIAGERAAQELDRFTAMFTRDFCGDVRRKADTDVTAADIASSNLVLFGDPGSNKILAKIAGQLPIKWTKDSIVVGDKTYSAADHVPVLIYPNPLNPKRYIVLNTGLINAGGGGGNNVQGYGDFAILEVTKQPDGKIADKVAQDGLFDESWKLPAKM